MAKLTQHLEWHGQQWRVVVKVPAKLRGIIGKTKLKHPLHTADLKEADARKWAVLARLKETLNEADRALKNGKPLEAEALQLRLQPDSEELRQHVHDRASAIADTHSISTAFDFAEVARKVSTPLDHYAEAFEKHKDYRTKTGGDFRRVLGWLKDWLKAGDHPAWLEDTNRKLAGAFIDECLAVGRGREKARAYLGFLKEYWRWLIQRGHVQENPWLGHDLPAAPRPPRDAEPDGGKRPYTEKEAAKLLYGPVDNFLRRPPRDYMRDLMHIAALSGMRLEEICQLRIADCEGDNFTIRQGKTDNARRTVPIHSQLAGIMARLTKGKRPGDYLIDGLPPEAPSRDSRSGPASQAFGRYRVKCGVDERPNGKAKSNIDFHSFRRTFIKAAKDRLEEGNASFSPWTIADVVGHDDEDVKRLFRLTMSHYPGQSSEQAKRAVVESVKLPPRPPATQRGKPDA